MAFGVAQAVFLFLSLTIISARPDINIAPCVRDFFDYFAYIKAEDACRGTECPQKCYATRMGWLNENLEPIRDEKILTVNLARKAISENYNARKYAQGYLKADCPRLLANGNNDCKSHDYHYTCAHVAGCNFALGSDSANVTKYSDVQFWIG